MFKEKLKWLNQTIFSEQISENRNNPKSLWQHLKQLGYKAHKAGNANIVLNIDNENCHSPIRFANHFNEFFTTVAAKLVDKLPCPSRLFDLNSKALFNFYKDRNNSNNKFVLKHVSESFVDNEQIPPPIILQNKRAMKALDHSSEFAWQYVNQNSHA